MNKLDLLYSWMIKENNNQLIKKHKHMIRYKIFKNHIRQKIKL